MAVKLGLGLGQCFFAWAVLFLWPNFRLTVLIVVVLTEKACIILMRDNKVMRAGMTYKEFFPMAFSPVHNCVCGGVITVEGTTFFEFL